MDDIIKVIKSLKSSDPLIDVATERAKHQIKISKSEFVDALMAPVAASLIELMASSLIQTMAFSLIISISGKRVMKAGKEKEHGILLLLALPLMMKVLGKGVTRARKGYNNRDHTDKST